MGFRLKEPKQNRTATVGERVRFVRQLNKDSMAEMARKIGVNPATISSWERGKTQPRVDYLSRIALAYGVSMDYLICLIDYYKPLKRRSIKRPS